MRNLTVIACNIRDGFYYPGFISESLDNAIVTVYFHSIIPGALATEEIIHIGGAVSCPILAAGDHALVRVYQKPAHIEYYVPATVIALPRHQNYQTKCYTVHLYNGMCVTKTRIDIVKIGPRKHGDILRYLCAVNHIELDMIQPEKILHEPRLTRHHRSDPPIITTMLIPNTELIRLADPQYRRMLGRLRRSSGSLNSLHIIQNYMSNTVVYRSLGGARIVRSPWCYIGSSRHIDQRDGLNGRLNKQWYPSINAPSDVGTSVTSTKSTQTITTIEAPRINTNDNEAVLDDGLAILARWPDDGWYYHSKVVTETETGDDEYAVVDSTGQVETLARTDILVHSEREFNTIQPFDRVIALHPNYVFSYAPAVIRRVFQRGVQLEFYDNVPAKLSYEEVYKITEEKYMNDVEYIEECEQRLCDKEVTVIARDNVTGEYKQCTAESPVGTSQQLNIRWEDGTQTAQCANHIFGSQTQAHNRSLRDWQYALAPTDGTCSVYLPAEVETRSPLRLKFCNDQRTEDVSLDKCFWISRDYFEHASEFYNHRHQPVT